MMRIRKMNLLIISAVFSLLISGMALFNQTNSADVQDLIPSFSKDRSRFYEQLGADFSKTMTGQPKAPVLVKVNHTEFITLNEFNYYKDFERGKAKIAGERIPSDQDILNELIDRKIRVAEARSEGLYPSDQQIDAYIHEQQSLMSTEGGNDVKRLIKGWGISLEDYFNFMKPIWADSMAIENWYSQNILSSIPKPTSADQQECYSEFVNAEYEKEMNLLKEKASIEKMENTDSLLH